MLYPSGRLIAWAKFKDIQHSEVLCICDWQWHIGCWIQEATGHDIMMMNAKSEKGLMPRIIVIILFIINLMGPTSKGRGRELRGGEGKDTEKICCRSLLLYQSHVIKWTIFQCIEVRQELGLSQVYHDWWMLKWTGSAVCSSRHYARLRCCYWRIWEIESSATDLLASHLLPSH